MQITPRKRNLAIAILTIAAIISGMLAINGCYSTPPIEISSPETIAATRQIKQVYIGGAVNNPGFYPLKDGDTMESLIQPPGGVVDGAELGYIELNIAQAEEGETPQRIDINLADAWLLEALPGIGEVKAQAIIDYRQQNGLFNNINELLNVDGIGESTLEGMKGLITVAD